MIVLDVETTGLNAERCSLISIGALDFDNPKDRFYEECRMWNGAEVTQEALNINGYTEAEIKDTKKKSEGELALNFFNWLEGKKDITVVGQNPHIDVAFTKAAANRAKERCPLGYRTVDLHSVTFYHLLKRGLPQPLKHNKAALDSDTIMAYVGIPAEPKPHIAINGALWEYEALYRLIYDKPGLEEFRQYPIPWLN